MKNKSLSIISLVFAFTFALLVCLGGLTVGASDGLWITDGVSDPTDYDYSFAVVGDTQKLVAHYANKLVLERGDADEIKYKYNYDVHEYPEKD